MDNVTIKFLKMVLPYVVDIITHIFTTILMSSNYPATWKTSKITLIAKTNNPCVKSENDSEIFEDSLEV
jgi:hypothetical protein